MQTRAKTMKLPCHITVDAGRTQIAPSTCTSFWLVSVASSLKTRLWSLSSSFLVNITEGLHPFKYRKNRERGHFCALPSMVSYALFSWLRKGLQYRFSFKVRRMTASALCVNISQYVCIIAIWSFYVFMVCMIFADSKTVLAILGSFIVEAVYLFNSTCTFLLKALKSLVKDRRIACVKNWS